jgi:RND family efflux transporter MFP subunit
VLLLEQAEAELDAREDLARAQIAMIGTRLDALDVSDRMARRDLGRTRVYAPFAGVVAARHVEQGDRVSPGTPLFDLIAPSRVEVEVALPAGRYGDVAEGARIRLRLREDAAMLVDTRVTRIGPRIDPEARTFPVYVDLDDDDVASPVPPGAHVVADVDGPLHAGVLPVPREAFLGDRVFALVREDGEGAPVARERRPRVRAWLPGLALVEPGDGPEDLGDGDVVVVSNLEDIADGSRVRTVGAVTEPPAR